ncbi:MAG: 6-carboxytetrahydropterin synthase QueD [Spirochaetes bacterium RIFOXYB1_FULL_32_8]|nr:MAG: 6-carboxytetrahydropterin synthase QueD [Spirochaetes bacterium GWC1_27_15]OHD77517.1 MAG: 6-carboxytetrahydropterin synthase QueD [Spirochaetes bacterium RIFOXYB1_FULL_32_8]
MLITKEFLFDSAHKLENYDGKCANLHGHTYKLLITLSGTIKEDGIIIDFVKLKQIVNDVIIESLDHKYLNDIIKQPTAENLVVWIWNKLIPEFNSDKVKLHSIQLYETPTSSVTYGGE